MMDVRFVREEVGVDELMRIARKERAAKSQKRVDKADSPEEVAMRILEAQPSRGEREKGHRGEVSYITARELIRLTRRKQERMTVVSGRILERGEGGRIKSGSRPLDERTEELEEDNRMLSILSVQSLFLEDE